MSNWMERSGGADVGEATGWDGEASDGPGGSPAVATTGRGVGAFVRSAGDRLASTQALDRIAGPLQRVTHRLPQGPVKDALHGTHLGHPLHPLLTDVAIGCWTSAVVLDAIGGGRSRVAARRLVGLGVVSALPTAATGLADWSELSPQDRRIGVVHAASNAVATGLFAVSYLARRRPGRARGVATALAATAVATVGGFLGGDLAYRRAAGVNRNADVSGPEDWRSLPEPVEPDLARPVCVEVDGEKVLVVVDDGVPRAIGARCSHMGGPLHEGEISAGCVTCPWHRSVFRLADGEVVHGPATAPQPVYDVQAEGGRWRVRRRPVPALTTAGHNGGGGG